MVATVLEEGFATRITADSYGGLLVVGVNWGDGEGDIEGAESDAIATTGTFTDPTSDYHDQRQLRRWFASWGHPIDSGNRLDRVISQTNLFLDKSGSFRDVARTEDDWSAATSRLGDVVVQLKPGGVLFLSIPSMRRAFSHANQKAISSWQAAFGDLRWANPCRFGTFEVQFPISDPDRIPVAGITHPSAWAIWDDDVSAAASVMRGWLDATLGHRQLAGAALERSTAA
jgi:hypothetical protein